MGAHLRRGASLLRLLVLVGSCSAALAKKNRTVGGVYVPNKLAGELKMMWPGLQTWDPLAVCADGSPSYVYLRRGFSADTWLIYLQGGPACYDEASCAAQQATHPNTMSSRNWNNKVFLSGIFSKETEGHGSWFSSANVAYVGYCSGDGWMGDAQNGDYQFRGQRIVNAAVKMLVNETLGSSPVTHVLFGGCSPGGIVYLDSFRGMMEAAGSKSKIIELQGLFDSVLWIDIRPPAGPRGSLAGRAGAAARPLPIMNATRSGAEYLNASALYGDACEAAYGEGGSWRCIFPQFRLPFVQTPYLLNAPQFDRGQIQYYESHPGRTNRSVAFADEFQNRTLAVIAGLPTAAQKGSFVFSSACFASCPSLSAAYWNVRVQGMPVKSRLPLLPEIAPPPLTLANAVRDWFFQQRRGLRVVQDCRGWHCGRCQANEHESPAERKKVKEKEIASLIAPMLITLFLVVVCCGCCMAFISADGRTRTRRILADQKKDSGEDTPLVPAAWRAAFPGATKLYEEKLLEPSVRLSKK